jgi:hypothetical protein
MNFRLERMGPREAATPAKKKAKGLAQPKRVAIPGAWPALQPETQRRCFTRRHEGAKSG